MDAANDTAFFLFVFVIPGVMRIPTGGLPETGRLTGVRKSSDSGVSPFKSPKRPRSIFADSFALVGSTLGGRSWRASRLPRGGRVISGAEVRSPLPTSPNRGLDAGCSTGGGAAREMTLGCGVPNTADRKALSANVAAGVSGAFV